jgi:hypothetical protein
MSRTTGAVTSGRPATLIVSGLIEPALRLLRLKQVPWKDSVHSKGTALPRRDPSP